jgi:hypothetical protein
MDRGRALGVAVGAVLAATALGVGSVSAGAQSGGGPHIRVIASGLDNPRDLDFVHGALYVAEAGHGGTHCTPAGPDQICVGLTSKISRIHIRAGVVQRVVRHLISTAGADGSAATGVDGISIPRPGVIFGIEAGSRDTVPSGVFPDRLTRAARAQLGRLIKVRLGHHARRVGDVGHRDYVWSSHHTSLVPGQFPDANPYGVFVSRNGRQRWVVDAGSNTIDRVDRRHRVHVVKFIPNPPASDAVPTCIDRGRDGAYYIGELTGGGNAPGSARVWRFAPHEHPRLTVWARGLTAITGCGFNSRGRFIAVEFSTLGLDNAAPGTGAVVGVPPHSTTPVTIVGGLNFPGGFAAGPKGRLFVSTWSIAPAKNDGGPTGRVVRITP